MTAAALLLGMSGCVAVSDEKVEQLDQIGDVQIATMVCASRPTATATDGCPLGNTQTPAVQSADFQLLVSFRVPNTTRAPDKLVSDPDAGADIALVPSPSLSSEMERLAPAPNGEQWVGYISGPLQYQATGGHYRALLLSRWGLDRAEDGTPFSGPFRHRTVVGYRTVRGEQGGPERPVDCGDRLDGGTTGGSEYDYCMDWPSPEELPNSVVTPVRDIGIVSGPAVRSTRNTTVGVPFTFHHRGGPNAPAFAIHTSTDIPGTEAVSQARSFVPPPNSASPFLVTIDLPSNTPAGTYEVTLTASLANGQKRTAVRRLQVTTGTDRHAPALALALPPRITLADVLDRGLPIDAACSEACRLSATLRIPRSVAKRARLAASREVSVGRGRARIATAGRGVVTIALTRRAARRLRGMRGLKARAVVQARDTAGNRTVRSKRIVLR